MSFPSNMSSWVKKQEKKVHHPYSHRAISAIAMDRKSITITKFLQFEKWNSIRVRCRSVVCRYRQTIEQYNNKNTTYVDMMASPRLNSLFTLCPTLFFCLHATRSSMVGVCVRVFCHLNSRLYPLMSHLNKSDTSSFMLNHRRFVSRHHTSPMNAYRNILKCNWFECNCH